MGIVLFRIDDRLIHGQVVEGWFHFLRPDCVVVADDEAAKNEFQRSLMELVVPYGISTEILTIQDAVTRCRDGAYEERRAIMLFRHPRDVISALDQGLSIDRLNLGGLHGKGRTKSLCKGVAATEEDLRNLHAILEAGVEVDVRPVPLEAGLDLRKLI